MITKMKKLNFLIFHREYDSFLETLRSLGVVHINTVLEGAAKLAGLDDDLKYLARLQTVATVLDQYAGNTAAAVPDIQATQVLDRYDALVQHKALLEQTMQSLSRDRALLQPWGSFDWQRVSQLENAGYRLRFHSCTPKSFKPEWHDLYNAVEIEEDKQKLYFVTITPAGTEFSIDAEECRLPDRSLDAVEADIAGTTAQIAAIPQQLSELSACSKDVLEAEMKTVRNRIGMEKVRLSGQNTCADALILLEGWAPARKADSILHEFEGRGVYCDVQDPEPGDDIPIELDNNRFARLFEPLTKLYMLPSYRELDLTLMFAPFFMLFFGLCLGDMGYGLLMIVALPVFTKLFQLINPNFSKWLVVLFGASTILCGTLSGTFFGFNIYDLDVPFVQKMKSVLYTDNSTMFTVSLCIGVVQILFGMALKAVNLTIQCGFKAAISTVGWLLLLITVAVCALLGIDFASPIVIALMSVAGICIFLLNSPGKNPLLNIGLGLWDTYNMATGLLGDVLSYVRLFALGLSGGILANVFNSMAIGMKPDNAVAGFIVMALIFVIGHALNIFMNILGAIVHPMRLTFVEFFKNAGYEGGGREYNPFKNE